MDLIWLLLFLFFLPTIIRIVGGVIYLLFLALIVALVLVVLL